MLMYADTQSTAANIAIITSDFVLNNFSFMSLSPYKLIFKPSRKYTVEKMYCQPSLISWLTIHGAGVTIQRVLENNVLLINNYINK